MEIAIIINGVAWRIPPDAQRDIAAMFCLYDERDANDRWMQAQGCERIVHLVYEPRTNTKTQG